MNPPSQPEPTPGRQPRRAAAVVVAVLLAGGAAVLAAQRWLGPRSPQSSPPSSTDSKRFDPRVSYPGPYRNVRPEVRYVGDAACAGCHPMRSEGFHRHPMGRSIVPAARLADALRVGKDANNPFED